MSAKTLAQAVIRALLSMRVQAVGAWHHVVPVVSGSLDQATKAVWLAADGRWASPIFLSLVCLSPVAASSWHTSLCPKVACQQ